MDNIIYDVAEDYDLTLNGMPASVFEYEDKLKTGVQKVILIQNIPNNVNTTEEIEEIESLSFVTSQENFLKSIKENNGKFKI